MDFSSHSVKNTFSEYIQKIQDESVRAWEQYEMVVIPGYEITKNSFSKQRSAHILVLGTDRLISPDLSVVEILKAAKDLGALTVAAHPFHTGQFEFQSFELWENREGLKPLIDAWEVNLRDRVVSEVLNSGLPLIANSDFHHGRHFRSWKTKVYSRKEISDIFEAIRRQRVDFFFDESCDLDVSPLQKSSSFPLSHERGERKILGS